MNFNTYIDSCNHHKADPKQCISPNTNSGCPFIVKASPISKLWQPWTSSLFWVLPFPECHANGNIQYVIF